MPALSEEPDGAAHEVRAQKAAAREQGRAAREAVPPERRSRLAVAVRERLAALPEVRSASAVAAYAAAGAEVDLDPLLSDLIGRDVEVYLPAVEGPDLALAAVRHLRADVTPGFRGVREPREGLTRTSSAPVDVALVPGVAFARDGTRVGYGGGHFDRLLARLPEAVLVGVAFDAQLVDRLPRENHDQRMHIIVTEAVTLRA